MPPSPVILAMDEKFQNYLQQLPFFFQLDAKSIRQSSEIRAQRPSIMWQALNIHFSVHTRLCRLHRPFHVTGMTDLKYAYSRTVSVDSAQRVLELRKSMDDVHAQTPSQTGLRPARLWTVMNHVFQAALTLATDVSFNPGSPEAGDFEAKVMTAYETLDKTREESRIVVETVRNNMQTLLKALHDKGARDRPEVATTSTTTTIQDGTGIQENLDQLWSDFLAVAPEMDEPEWNSLFNDVDFLC